MKKKIIIIKSSSSDPSGRKGIGFLAYMKLIFLLVLLGSILLFIIGSAFAIIITFVITLPILLLLSKTMQNKVDKRSKKKKGKTIDAEYEVVDK